MNSPEKQTTSTAIVARNTTYQFIGKGIAMVLSMLVLAVIARFLTEEEYGLYTMISTIFVVVVGFTELKVEQAAIRRISIDESKLNFIVQQLAAAKVIFAIAITAVSVFLITLSSLPYAVKIGASVVSIGAVINAAQSGFYTAIQYNLKVYLFTLAEVISKIVTTIQVVLIAWLGYSFFADNNALLLSFSFISLLIPATIILICFGYWATKWLGIKVSWQIDREYIGSLVKESWPLWLMDIMAILQVRLATFLMIGLQSAQEVGVFGLAYRFIDVAATLPPLFTASVFPLLTRYAASDSVRAKAITQKSFDFLAILILIIAVVTVYASPQIVQLFGGFDKYTGSVQVLRILTGSMIAMYLAGVLGPYLVSVHGQRYAVYAAFIGIITNLLLGLWLIPNHSYTGAALAVSVSDFAILASMLWFMATRFNFIPRLGVLIRSAAAALLTLAILWFTRLNQFSSASIVETFGLLTLIGVIGIAIYGVIVWRWKVIPTDVLVQSVSMLPLPNKVKRFIHG